MYLSWRMTTLLARGESRYVKQLRRRAKQ